jgi:hypothetical protein
MPKPYLPRDVVAEQNNRAAALAAFKAAKAALFN